MYASGIKRGDIIGRFDFLSPFDNIIYFAYVQCEHFGGYILTELKDKSPAHLSLNMTEE